MSVRSHGSFNPSFFFYRIAELLGTKLIEQMGDNNIALAEKHRAGGQFQLSLKAMSNMLPSAKTPTENFVFINEISFFV